MENSVEALKMAAAVLIFVLALTITISTFTLATQTLNKIFTAQDADQYVTVKDNEGNDIYLNFVNFDGGTREVGVETIVPSIYRAYKENYSIYFFDSDGKALLLYEDVNYIDLEKEHYASAEAAIENVENLLYKQGLYNYLQGKTFNEKLGEYYMDDINGKTEAAEVNKTKKRVIVYTQQ